MKHHVASTLLIGFSLLASGSLPAAESRFLFYRTAVNVPDAPPREGFTLITESCELVFMPPRESLVSADSAAREIKVWYRDGRSFMKLTPSTNSPALAKPAAWEQLRAIVQTREPGAEVGAAVECINSSMPGCYFDVHRTTSASMKIITRVAFVPYQNGMFEISLTATEAKFPTQMFAFNSFLNSLRFDKPKSTATQTASN